MRDPELTNQERKRGSNRERAGTGAEKRDKSLARDIVSLFFLLRTREEESSTSYLSTRVNTPEEQL